MAADFGRTLREMARVVQPGGYLIVTTDNRLRLNHVIHPFAWARVFGLQLLRLASLLA